MTDQTNRPMYQQVADDLRKSIAAGIYPVGAELPSTSQLTARYSASTTVVRAAIRELRTEGLVVGQPGKAVYVQATPDAESTTFDDLSDVSRELATLRRTVADLDARLSALEGRREPEA